MWSCAVAGQISWPARFSEAFKLHQKSTRARNSEKEGKKERKQETVLKEISMHTFVWEDLARIDKFFFQHQITIATLFMFRSKNHHGQSNEQQRQQQKLDPAFGRAKEKVRQNRTRTGNCWWAGCMWEGQYKHLVFGHDRSHPGPRRCAARAGIWRSCPHTQVVLSTSPTEPSTKWLPMVCQIENFACLYLEHKPHWFNRVYCRRVSMFACVCVS